MGVIQYTFSVGEGAKKQCCHKDNEWCRLSTSIGTRGAVCVCVCVCVGGGGGGGGMQPF